MEGKTALYKVIGGDAGEMLGMQYCMLGPRLLTEDSNYLTTEKPHWML